MISSVRLIGAECNMEPEAADVVYGALVCEAVTPSDD
jgi:hypothetical protein